MLKASRLFRSEKSKDKKAEITKLLLKDYDEFNLE
jgi:hypothetical protein